MKRFSLLLSLFFVLVLPLPAETPAHPTGTVDIGGLRFIVPKAWVEQTPSSAMRAAQWGLLPVKGSDYPGEVVAFYFGPGQGGDTKANIDRWLTTMTTAAGTPAQGDVSMRKSNGFNVIQLLVFGTYMNSMATPGLPSTPRAGWGLIGAVVERPEGAVFFRLTGPEALVKSQLLIFTKFIDSIKSAS